MKNIITIVLFSLIASFGINCYAQNQGDKSKEVCHTGNYNDSNAAKQSAGSCYSAGNTGLGAAIERKAAQAARDHANSSGQSGNSRSSSDTGGATRASSGSSTPSSSGPNSSKNGNTSSAQSCKTCSDRANGLKDSRKK